ncbi:MAG: hypothetical protein AB8A48_02635, partial [Prochlorococcus sp.]
VKVLKVDVLRNQIDLEVNRSVAESQTDGELEITQESKEADINKSKQDENQTMEQLPVNLSEI